VAIRRMLANIQVAPDHASALTAIRDLADGQAVVSRAGHLYWSGLQQRRSDDGADGVLLRERLLGEVEAENQTMQNALKQAQDEQQKAVDELKAAEQKQQQALRELDQSRRQNAEAKTVMQSLQDKRGSLQQRRVQRSEELAEVQKLQSELQQDQDRAQQLLQQSREELQALEQQERAQQFKSDEARKALQDARHRQQSLQRQLDNSRERRAALASDLAATQAANEALAARRADVDRNLADSKQNQDDLKTPVPVLEQAVQAALAQRDGATGSLQQARQGQEAAAQAARDAANMVLKLEQASQGVRAQLQEQQLGEQRLLAHRESLEEQVRESGVRIQEILDEVQGEMPANACEEELEKLDLRIQRLGAVNLAAVEEYEEEKKRADYLRAQEADLVDALEKLESAIRQIDKETRSRFRATFEAVNEKFKIRFPKLFGGGEAYLELTGEDVLDAGVRVMARPPGKRNATIQLLSGGEKAMTAVALVFALFELNPAPFCMLDEVDAPLDDANVVRYCEVVREMSEHVQFIIVTHNKVTMELAQQLNGVTMQEPGVSRLVSVDVQQAVALAG
ncbi:MAG: chromosome segregation protein SMC, partial [Oceanococcus sp.]